MVSENPIDSLMKWNCSTIFLLYPLGLSRQILNEYGFVEAYLKDEYLETEYKNPVFLLFKPKNMTLFQGFIEEEQTRENENTNTFDFREDYDRGNGEVVLVYEFPESLSGDYQKFLRGEYSKFSDKMVSCYPKTIEIKEFGRKIPILGSQYRIITKDKESEKILNDALSYHGIYQIGQISTMTEMLEERFGTYFTEDMELWQKPDMNKETLKYDNSRNK